MNRKYFRKHLFALISGAVMMGTSIVVVVLFGTPEPPHYELIAAIPLFVVGGWFIIYSTGVLERSW